MIVYLLLGTAYASVIVYNFYETGKRFDNGDRAMGLMHLSIGIIFLLILASYLMKVEITNDIKNIVPYD